MIARLFCFTYEVDGHCQHVLMAADTMEAAAHKAAEAAPDDWTLVDQCDIPLPDLLNGVALPWF
jgi:hypothetical protein